MAEVKAAVLEMVGMAATSEGEMETAEAVEVRVALPEEVALRVGWAAEVVPAASVAMVAMGGFGEGWTAVEATAAQTAGDISTCARSARAHCRRPQWRS